MNQKSPTFSSVEQVKNYVASIQWDKRLKREIPFLEKLFKTHNYKRIIDLGSGPGFHAKELAKRDLVVKGIDVSEGMTLYANEFVTDPNLNLSFEIGNFLDNENVLSGDWDVIYSLGNAVMIIWSQESVDIQEMFNKISKGLTKNGAFFFQILNSDNPRKGYVVSNIAKNEEKNTNQVLIKHFLPVNDILYTNFITIKWEEGRHEIIKEENEPGQLKLVSLEKLKKHLTNAGFNKFEFYENYNGDPLNKETSDSLLCFAQK
ncbi:MAG: class I SAM-dependent methyltransferase [Candidatus Hodarchaeales archaeon]